MQVKVISFGMLKDRLGSEAAVIELEDGSTVADLMRVLTVRCQADEGERRFAGIAVGVNAEYASATQLLSDGDEVALLPPVSGGSTAPTADPSEFRDADRQIVALTREHIEGEKLVAGIKHAEDGAVVVFDGIVRNHSRGRQTLYLDYEAYEEMALNQMRALAVEARERFGVRHVTIVHRLGRLEIGETSVLIVVASAHRAQAFDACRWLIDTLKQTVPIWKRETFADGAVWAPGEPFPASMALSQAEAKRDE